MRIFPSPGNTGSNIDGYGGYASDGPRPPTAHCSLELKAQRPRLDIGRTTGFMLEDFMLALLGLERHAASTWRCEAMHYGNHDDLFAWHGITVPNILAAVS
jgi:hypothetical protein